MTSFDSVLERILREEGWDVSRGPVPDSLLVEGPGERVLLTWSSGDDGASAGEGGGTEVLRAQADARPAGEPEAEPDPQPEQRTDAAGPGPDEPDAELLDTSTEPSPDPQPQERAEAGGPGPDEPDAELLGGSPDPSPEPEPEGGDAEIIDASVDPEPETGPREAGEPGDAGAPAAGPADPPSSGVEELDAASPADRAASAPSRVVGEDDVQADEVPVVRLRVDRQEALSEAEPKLLTIEETTLELVPHLAFEYTCRVPDGTGDVETYRGNILCNALTESVLTLEAPRFADGVPEGARLLEPRVDRGEAVPAARDHLEDTYTRDVKVEEGDGNVSMMETRRVSPDEDGIDLDDEGTWYVPVWRLVGENGEMRLDANRGEVLDETLDQVTGTDAEWVA